MLIEPISFTQYSFEIITVNSFLKIFFGNRNAYFYFFAFAKSSRIIKLIVTNIRYDKEAPEVSKGPDAPRDERE